MKTVLVTGGNRGIGLEICRQLDMLGHRVILGSRNLEKGAQAAANMGPNVIVKELDVTNEESIVDLAHFVKDSYGRLDVLINNAGLGSDPHSAKISISRRLMNFLEKNLYGLSRAKAAIVPFLRKSGVLASRESAANIPMDKVWHIMDTNLYGPWRMIQAFIPLMENTPGARIINISSGQGELESLTGEYPGYSLSKASLNALTIMFSNELKSKGISVNAVCPGWVRTDMGGPLAPHNAEQGADTAVWLAVEQSIPTGKFFRDRNEIKW